MTKCIKVLIGTLLFAGLGFSQSVLNVGNALKNHQEEGYKFTKTNSETSWQVEFKLPEWEYSWKVNVFIGKAKSNPDFDILYAWTRVLVLNNRPSIELMEELLYSNADDSNWGTFSIGEYEDGRWYIDYNVKMRHKFVNKTELINAVGWVAGYANGIYETLKTYVK